MHFRMLTSFYPCISRSAVGYTDAYTEEDCMPKVMLLQGAVTELSAWY